MIKQIAIIAVVLLLLIVIGYFVFFRTKPCNSVAQPGVGYSCKCDQGGDNSIKFYKDNWKARGAVCDGLYIPSGLNLGGQNPVSVLEQMENLYAANPNLKNNMAALAIEALNKSVRTQK